VEIINALENKMENEKAKKHFRKKWEAMNFRCYNEKYERSKYYKGKGIIVEWKNFYEFERDMFSSYLMHLKKYGEKETTIDREDNDKNYCKENCRWATWHEQHQNTGKVKHITHGGLTLTIHDWAKKIGITESTLYSRLDKLRMPIEKALASNKYNTNGKII
jgi:hypothetical protein